MNESESLTRESAALACLSEVIDLLKEQADEHRGEVEGLGAYQALSRIFHNAQAYGLPLELIGMSGFDPDIYLQPKRQAA